MPTVPGLPADMYPPGEAPGEKPSDLNLMMALATMKDLGRWPQLPMSDNIEDRRNENKPEGDYVDDAAEEAAFRTRRKYLRASAEPMEEQ